MKQITISIFTLSFFFGCKKNWLNERNPDGYLNASANADFASLKAYYKYACFKN